MARTITVVKIIFKGSVRIMSKECIIHFKHVRNGVSKDLRGLIFVKEGETPTIAQFIDCFARMGYKVALEDEQRLIFKPVNPSEQYLLDIEALDFGEKKESPDAILRMLAEQLLPPKKYL